MSVRTALLGFAWTEVYLAVVAAAAASAAATDAAAAAADPAAAVATAKTAAAAATAAAGLTVSATSSACEPLNRFMSRLELAPAIRPESVNCQNMKLFQPPTISGDGTP